jgi:S1-C subfamily serine protease
MDFEKRHEKILIPCVRVRAAQAGGSGTVLYSDKNAEGGYSTYVLTNHHVVDGLIKVDKKWSTLLKRDVKTDVFGIPEVQFFQWRWESRVVGAQSIECDIMTYDADEDLALLKLRSDTQYTAVSMYPKDKERELRLTMPVMAVGAGLGEPPVVTGGFLTQFGREIDNKEYWLQTAPTIYGNSGGAVFLQDTYEFIGVPARIAVSMGGFSADAITHLSYIVPITRVYEFLESQLFRFIYDKKFTEKGEALERDRRRKEEEMRMAAREEVKQEDAEQDS